MSNRHGLRSSQTQTGCRQCTATQLQTDKRWVKIMTSFSYQQYVYYITSVCVSSFPVPAIFNLFHLMAHINYWNFAAHQKLYYIFADLTKKIGIILIHSHRMLFLCWPLSFFLFNNLRGKRSVPLTRYSGIACFKKILWQSSWKSLSYTIIFITSQTLLTSKCLATLHIIYKAMLNTLMYILLPISDYSLSVELLDQGYF